MVSHTIDLQGTGKCASHLSTCTCPVLVYPCMSVCMSVCVWVVTRDRAYVCKCVHVYVWTPVYVCVLVRAQLLCTFVGVCASVPVRVRARATYSRVHVCTIVYAYPCTFTRVCVRLCTCSLCMSAIVSVYVYKRASVYVYMSCACVPMCVRL